MHPATWESKSAESYSKRRSKSFYFLQVIGSFPFKTQYTNPVQYNLLENGPPPPIKNPQFLSLP